MTLTLPPDYRGPVALPGTGRIVWWTGRVAIGLNHQPTPQQPGSEAVRIQQLLLEPQKGT